MSHVSRDRLCQTARITTFYGILCQARSLRVNEIPKHVLTVSLSLSFFSPYAPQQSLILYWYLVLKKNLPFVRPFSFKSEGFPRTLRIIPSNHSLILFRNKGRGDSAFAK